jgi:hypothetical protein
MLLVGWASAKETVPDNDSIIGSWQLVEIKASEHMIKLLANKDKMVLEFRKDGSYRITVTTPDGTCRESLGNFALKSGILTINKGDFNETTKVVIRDGYLVQINFMPHSAVREMIFKKNER